MPAAVTVAATVVEVLDSADMLVFLSQSRQKLNFVFLP